MCFGLLTAALLTAVQVAPTANGQALSPAESNPGAGTPDNSSTGAGRPSAVAANKAGTELAAIAAATEDPLAPWQATLDQALRDWRIERPRLTTAVVNQAKGHRVIMTHTQKLRSAGQQAKEVNRPTEADDAAVITWVRHMELLVFPQGAKPDTAASAMPWTADEALTDQPPYAKKAVCLGRGLGFEWYARATYPEQEMLRAALQLEGGDDRLALLTEALFVEDSERWTRNSVELLLGVAGDRALPYLKTAIEQRDNAKPPIAALGYVRTEAATEYLQSLYAVDKHRESAAYALAIGPSGRKAAKAEYLDMLRRRLHTSQAMKAAVQFGWDDAVPAIEDLFAKPASWWEFFDAFESLRALRKQPVPEDVTQAGTSSWSWEAPPTPATEAQIKAAQETLLKSRDVEAAAMTAIRWLAAAGKIQTPKAELVHRAGREVLLALPPQVVKPLLTRVATLHDSSTGVANAQALLRQMGDAAQAAPSPAPAPETPRAYAQLAAEHLKARDEALAAAGRTLRDGLATLAKTYPQLATVNNKPLGEAMKEFDAQARKIDLTLGRSNTPALAPWTPEAIADAQTWRLGATLREIAATLPADAPREQRSLYPVFPRLGLEGNWSAAAGDPKLDEALRKLLDEALRPLKNLDQQVVALRVSSRVKAGAPYATPEDRLVVQMVARMPDGWELANRQPGQVTPKHWQTGPGLQLLWRRPDTTAEDLKRGTGGELALWIMDQGYSPKESLNATAEGAGPQQAAARELASWRGRRVFVWGAAAEWPRPHDDVADALKAAE
jgi:hypothetical protein